MTDRKISELTNITGADLADNDEFVVVDTSADETKAITYGELKNFNGTITSDGLTVDGTGKATFGSVNRYIQNPTGTELRIGADSSSGVITAYTNASEAMRIDSSGNLLVGTTSSIGIGDTTGNGFQVNSGGNVNIKRTCTTSTQGLLHLNNIGTQGQVVEFYQDGSQVGNISVTSSVTTYNTSSDYRLKTDAQPMVGASDRVLALKPVNFEWIADGTRVDGFLAHEAQAVVPEAVTGTHNEVDDDGNAVMQGIDQSKLVPLLTAALQEALTKIDALETRITALEGA